MKACTKTAPRSGGGELVPRLISISKAVRQLVGIRLAACGVLVGQDQFLLCFADAEALSVAEIATRLSVRASTVSKMADILSQKGWTEKRSHGADGRKVIVRLTAKGRAVRDEAAAVEAILEAELRQMLGEDGEVLSALARLDAVLAERLNRLR